MVLEVAPIPLVVFPRRRKLLEVGRGHRQIRIAPAAANHPVLRLLRDRRALVDHPPAEVVGQQISQRPHLVQTEPPQLKNMLHSPLRLLQRTEHAVLRALHLRPGKHRHPGVHQRHLQQRQGAAHHREPVPHHAVPARILPQVAHVHVRSHAHCLAAVVMDDTPLADIVARSLDGEVVIGLWLYAHRQSANLKISPSFRCHELRTNRQLRDLIPKSGTQLNHMRPCAPKSTIFFLNPLNPHHNRNQRFTPLDKGRGRPCEMTTSVWPSAPNPKLFSNAV